MVFKHPEKLSVIIAYFISGEENSNQVSGQGIFPQVTVLTATVPPYLLKRLKEIYHTDPNFQCVISQCQGLFPPAFSAAEQTPGNEVPSFAGGPKYFENMADSKSEFDFCVSHDQR